MRGRERGRRALLDRTAVLTAILTFLSTSVFFTLIHYEDSWISHFHLEVRGHIPHVQLDGGSEAPERAQGATSPQQGRASGELRPDDFWDGAKTGVSPEENGLRSKAAEAGDGPDRKKRLVGPDVLGDVSPGTPIFVTFATGSMSDFAFNWCAKNRQKLFLRRASRSPWLLHGRAFEAAQSFLYLRLTVQGGPCEAARPVPPRGGVPGRGDAREVPRRSCPEHLPERKQHPPDGPRQILQHRHAEGVAITGSHLRKSLP